VLQTQSLRLSTYLVGAVRQKAFYTLPPQVESEVLIFHLSLGYGVYNTASNLP
jgi:hypothetical protein